MTDKEIEKALEICSGANSADGCVGCPYDNPDLTCGTEFPKDCLDYINRLKAKNAEAKELCKNKVGDLITKEEHLKVCREFYEQGKFDAMVDKIYESHEKEQVRKETAKEILQELEHKVHWGYDYPDEPHSPICVFYPHLFEEMEEKYGLEVEE